MPDRPETKFKRYSRIAAAIVLAPVVFPITLLVMLGIFAPFALLHLVAFVANAISSPLRLAWDPRRVRTAELKQRMVDTPGTLIVEATRAWWTPDDLAAISPYLPMTKEDYRRYLSTEPAPTSPPDWDRWCSENYTGPGGTARLVTLGGGKLESRLAREFPGVNIVHHWTSLIHFRPAPATGRPSQLLDSLALIACAALLMAEFGGVYWLWNRLFGQ